jgi:hypothetical protein
VPAATENDFLSISADERIEVVTPTGGIVMRDEAGNPAGNLLLSSNSIIAADSALLGSLVADPNFAGRNEALRTNNGPVDLEGYLVAGGISFEVGQNLFVQNTGTATDFAGLTVGSGGLSISSQSRVATEGFFAAAESDSITVVAFGRQQNPDGTFTTGREFYNQTNFNQAEGTSYTDDSELNGLSINNPEPEPEPQPDGAFRGDPTVQSGSVELHSYPGSDLITVNSRSAIVNWTPYDSSGGPSINFLPFGTTATFQNGGEFSTFSILNRILPVNLNSRIEFNGTVISQLRDASGGVLGKGGLVAFYSPGGIFVSSTAVFDVGSLLLTSLDPVNFGPQTFCRSSGSRGALRPSKLHRVPRSTRWPRKAMSLGCAARGYGRQCQGERFGRLHRSRRRGSYDQPGPVRYRRQLRHQRCECDYP